ncbi:hypothetical protein DFO74_1459 [Chromohalobacter israelensis]|nr:hypothetical protein DFO74_1459 [Chromohalobacter salexigens]
MPPSGAWRLPGWLRWGTCDIYKVGFERSVSQKIHQALRLPSTQISLQMRSMKSSLSSETMRVRFKVASAMSLPIS